MIGALGIAWTVTTGLVTIDSEPLTIPYTSGLLALAAVTNGLFVAWLFAGWRGVKEGRSVIVAVGLLMGRGQIITALWNPLLGVMYLFTRMERFREPSPDEADPRFCSRAKRAPSRRASRTSVAFR